MGWYELAKGVPEIGTECQQCHKTLNEGDAVYFVRQGSKKDPKTGYYTAMGAVHFACIDDYKGE